MRSPVGPGYGMPPGRTPLPGTAGQAQLVPALPDRAMLHRATPITPPVPSMLRVRHTGLRAPVQRVRGIVVVNAIVGIVALIGVVAFFVWQNAKAADVTLYQVSVQNTTQYIGGGGIVFPRQQLDLSYPVAERVVDVLVKAGDTVAPDQALLRLDPTQLDAQVKQASDNMEAAQAYLDTVSASGNALNIAQAQQQYDLAKNKYNALVAQDSSLLVHGGNLVSPMKGVVTSVDINPGEVFSADTPLLTIMDESVEIVHVKVPLSNLGQVYSGQPATVTPSALPDLNLNGTVSSIIPQADPQTDTFEVWVSVANTRGTLLPGMSAFVRLQSQSRGIIVPRLVVLDPDRHPVVFVVRNQHAYLQHVQVVGRVRDSILIGSGLSAGDRIVLVGLDALRDGEAVRVKAVEGQSS